MQTRRNIIANYAGQGFASLLSLALVPVYIRYLGIEAYGLVGIFATLQVWLTLLDLGMTPTLGREMARFTAGASTVQHIRDLLRSLEIVVFGVAALVAAALFGASDWIARVWLDAGTLGVDAVAQALAFVGVVVALRFCEGIYRSAIIGLQQQVWLNAAQILLAVLRGGGAVAVLAFVAPTVQAFFVWQGIVSAVTLIVFGAKLHFALPAAPRRPRFSREALGAVRGFAGGMFAITLLAVVLTQVDKLLLSRLLSLADFGIYMLASTVAGGLYLVAGPIVQAVSPALARLLASGNEALLRTEYHRAAQLVSVLLAPAVLMLLLFPRGVLWAWSGNPALSDRAAPILAMLALGTFLNALMQVPYQLQLAAGWTALALRLNAVAVALLIPVLLWSVPRYGAVAAAATWAVLNAFYLLVAIPWMHRRLLTADASRWYVGDVLLPVVGAAAVLGIAWLARPDLAASRIEWLVFIALAGSFATLGAGLCASAIRGRLAAALDVVLRRRRAL